MARLRGSMVGAMALGALVATAAPAAQAVTPGCEREAAPAPLERVTVNGEQRILLTVVPESYTPDRAHALVLAFHGRTNSHDRVRRYYDLEPHAGDDVIFVYPGGRQLPDGTYTWADPEDPTRSQPDLDLFDALVEAIGARYCIDGERIFAVGHSLGGWYANTLGCARGEVLRAIASLGGTITRTECQGATAALLLHNPDDRLVPFRYGLEARNVFLDQNQLPRRSDPLELGRFECQHFGAEADDAPVLWCPHREDYTPSGRYYPHQWPHGTGEAIIDFLSTLAPAATTTADAGG
jgi:polyhydroxybutyrate depolymerase